MPYMLVTACIDESQSLIVACGAISTKVAYIRLQAASSSIRRPHFASEHQSSCACIFKLGVFRPLTRVVSYLRKV